MNRALLVIDFINEIVDSTGKLAAKGYSGFIAENDTFGHLNAAIGKFRMGGDPVIFVRLAFDPSYDNQPKGSPVFGKANQFGILADGTWSTEINKAVDFRLGIDKVVVKTRVSAFQGTDPWPASFAPMASPMSTSQASRLTLLWRQRLALRMISTSLSR